MTSPNDPLGCLEPPKTLLERWTSTILNACLTRNSIESEVKKVRELAAVPFSIVDYDAAALAHVYAYYWPNYLKTKLACRLLEYRPKAGCDFMAFDLGAGSGPAAAALVDYLRNDLAFPGKICITAVDLSASQLQLMKSLTVPYLISCGVEVHCRQEDARLLDLPADTSLFVASYYLSGLDERSRRETAVKIRRKALNKGADFLVLDDADCKVLEEVAEVGSWPTVQHTGRLPLTIAEDCVPQSGIEAQYKRTFTLLAGLFRGMAWTRRPNQFLSPLLLQYKNAWERHDVQLLASIFTSRSRYEISPDRILYGIEQIKRYWETNREVQRAVCFEISKWAESGELIYADWTAQFARLDLGRKLLLRGSLTMELAEERIRRFSEFYTRKVID